MKKNKITFLLVICLALVVLVSCSCNKRYYKTYTEMESALNEVYVKGDDESSATKRKEKLQEVVKVDALNAFDTFVSSYVRTSTTSEAEAINNIKNDLTTKIETAKSDSVNENQFTVKVSEELLYSFESVKTAAGTGYSNTGVNNNATITGDNFISAKTQEIKNVTLLSYLVFEA